ncbi:hypothetical protein [Paenibacillus taichungensis]|uniref:hypothetical protein n=1 Tax=Paenibacillus taichungensis TaxID=484184 RepID=UPI0039A08F80
MKTAKLKRNVLMLHLFRDEIQDDYVEVDKDCLFEFDAGTEVEILKEISIGEYADNQMSYVVYNPITNESVTLAASFFEFEE